MVVIRGETTVVISVVITEVEMDVTGGRVAVTVEVTVRELLTKYPAPAARTINMTTTATSAVRPMADKLDFMDFIPSWSV